MIIRLCFTTNLLRHEGQEKMGLFEGDSSLVGFGLALTKSDNAGHWRTETRAHYTLSAEKGKKNFGDSNVSYYSQVRSRIR